MAQIRNPFRSVIKIEYLESICMIICNAPSVTKEISNLICDQDLCFEECCHSPIQMVHLPDLYTDLHHLLENREFEFLRYRHETKSYFGIIVCIRQWVPLYSW